MYEKQLLLIPGPTMIPPRVLRAMSVPSMGHRSAKFSEIVREVSADLKKVFRTENDVYILTSSGSGAMEAAVVNFINAGDKVLVLVNGKFGERFVKMNQKVGADVIEKEFELGQAADPAEVKKILADDSAKEIKAVFVQHNETSSGILNDIKAIKEAMGDHPAILIVDAISGMGTEDFNVDESGADVVVVGSQKAFMIPPGLAFISVSPKAWAVNEKCTSYNFYFSLQAAKKNLANDTTPYTPATSLILGLRESLKIILENGLENAFARHALYKEMVRRSAEAMGLELLVKDEKAASPAITAVRVPEGINWGDVNKTLLNEFNVMVAGGQDELKGKIFRIGHIGYVQELDMLATIAALEMALKKAGYSIELGTGVKVAQEILLASKQ